MDSLTHALFAFLAIPSLLPPPFLFGILLGAIIPDIDILFRRLSDPYPSLYIFTHGGFSHSLAGGAAVAALAWIGIGLASIAGIPLPWEGAPAWLLIAVFAGVCTHLLLDVLASPGIPLLFPLTARKFSLGIFPGPSIVLMGASVTLAVMIAGGAAPGALSPEYATFCIGFVILSGGIMGYVRLHTRGMIIPTFHPLRWLVVRDEGASYVVERYDIIGGRSTNLSTYLKNDGVDERDLRAARDRPEVLRHRYYSYTVTASRVAEGILLRDPLRTEGILFYPPSYREVLIPGSSLSGTDLTLPGRIQGERAGSPPES